MRPYVIALDQGTTSSRAIVFDQNQNMVGAAQKEFAQLYPRAGYVAVSYTHLGPRGRRPVTNRFRRVI